MQISNWKDDKYSGNICDSCVLNAYLKRSIPFVAAVGHIDIEGCDTYLLATTHVVRIVTRSPPRRHLTLNMRQSEIQWHVHPGRALVRLKFGSLHKS